MRDFCENCMDHIFQLERDYHLLDMMRKISILGCHPWLEKCHPWMSSMDGEISSMDGETSSMDVIYGWTDGDDRCRTWAEQKLRDRDRRSF